VVLIEQGGHAVAGPLRPIEKVEITSTEVYDLRGILVR